MRSVLPRYRYLIWIGVLCLSYPLIGQHDEWKLQVDKHDIQVFTRKVEGHPIKEFKGVTTIRVHPSEILEVLTDLSTYEDWIYKCRHAELLSNDAPDEYTFRVEINVPFPAADRDVVQRMYIRNQPDGSVKVDIVAEPELAPKEDGLVRMPLSDGGWVLTPDANGGTHVSMQFLSDPGGSVPDWMVNVMLNDNPYNTLRNLREMLED